MDKGTEENQIICKILMDMDWCIQINNSQQVLNQSVPNKNYFTSTKAMGKPCRNAVKSHDDHDIFNGQPHSSAASYHPTDHLSTILHPCWSCLQQNLMLVALTTKVLATPQSYKKSLPGFLYKIHLPPLSIPSTMTMMTATPTKQ